MPLHYEMTPLQTGTLQSSTTRRLKLVVEVVVSWDVLLETLSLSDTSGQVGDLAVLVGSVTRQERPVVKDGLREGLSTSGGSEIGVETERLGNGQVGYGQRSA